MALQKATNWIDLAKADGWSLTKVQTGPKDCDHAGTDGTKACPKCKLAASIFLDAAVQWVTRGKTSLS